MTKLKPLGSRLISLLLALAMIAAFIPVISVTAAASDNAYCTLRENEPKYGSEAPWNEPWYWDGQTLNLYGSYGYSFNSSGNGGQNGAYYFEIESSNDEFHPTVLVSNSISMDLGSSGTFVYSEKDITVKGAGMIKATGTGTLFSSGDSISYYGGAILSDDALTVFSAKKQIAYAEGQVIAPNGVFSSPNFFMTDGYIDLDSITPADGNVSVTVYRGFLDLQTLMPGKAGAASIYDYYDCVIRSQDTSGDITDSNNGSLYLTCYKNDSVMYLPKMDNIGWLRTDDIRNVTAKEQVGCGGYVFCNQILTDAARNGENLLKGGENGVETDLQGVFYYSTDSTAGELYLDNLNFNNSGSLFICDRSLYASGVTAKEATLAVIANSTYCAGAYFDDYKSLNSNACSNSYESCTLVAAADDPSAALKLGVDSTSVNNCNAYLSAADCLSVTYKYDTVTPDPDNLNSYYAPNGTVRISDKYSLNRYVDVTASKFEFSIYPFGDTPVICGNVYAGEYTANSDPVIFDGSDAYDVCINSVPFDLEFSSSTGYIHEYKDSRWSYYSPSQGGVVYSGKNPIYVGRRVLSPIAGQAVYNDPLTVTPGLPAKITIPLTYPFVNGAEKMELALHDEDGQYDLDWSDIGVDVTIPDSTGKKEAVLVLTANENAKSGDYFLYCNLNGVTVSQNGTNEIFFTVSESNSHTMEFTRSTSGWPYIDSKGDLKTFTAADYAGSVDADTWSWDGSTKTLTLKNSGSFVTTANTGILIEGEAYVYVESDWKISAGDIAAISSDGDLTINGADDGQDMYQLTLNTGLRSGADLNVDHLYIDVLPDASCSSDLLTAYDVSLNECELTANDNWIGLYAINAANSYFLRRDVVLNLPASKFDCLSSAYIADVESSENLKLRSGAEIAAGSAYEIDNSNQTIPDTLAPIDDAKRIKLSTKAFAVDGTNAVMYDETVSSLDGETPEYKLLGGKQYRLDLTDFISIDYKDCGFMIDSFSSSTFAGKPVYDVFSLVDDADGRTFLVADVPNAADSSTTLKIGVRDYKQNYSSNKGKYFTATIGGVAATDKIGFYHEGNYDKPATDHYTVSAEYNGKPLEMTGTGVDAYFLVPSGESFDITLIPDDDYRFETMRYGTGAEVSQWTKYDISPNGTYRLTANGDGTVYLALYKSSEPQYVNLGLSADLQKSIADGKITSATLRFPNGVTRTFDSTNADSSVIVLNNSYIGVDIAVQTQDNKPKYGVKSINGVIPGLDDDTLIYSGDISVYGDTAVAADIGELCGINIIAINILNPYYKVYVKDAPQNTLGQYYSGTEYEILAKPGDGKLYGDMQFNQVDIKPVSEDADGRHYFITPAAGDNEISTYYLDISILRIVKPENGTVAFSGRLDNGRSVTTLGDGTQVYSVGTWDEITLTLTPDPGYQLRSAVLNGSEVAVTNNAYTFNIEQSVDWSFVAEFEEIPADSFTVTVNSGADGTVTPGTKSYESGTEVTLTVTPDPGYQVKSVTMDGREVALTDGRYTFTVTADCTFAAEFEKIPADSFTVTVNSGANGTVTPGTKSYVSGTEVTLTVTPDSGYKVKSVTMDGRAVALTDGRYTFTVTADCTFAAEFVKKSSGISYGGHVRPSGTETAGKKPTLNGSEQSWTDMASALGRAPENSSVQIHLNGETTVPSEIVRAIMERKVRAEFIVDSTRSWIVSGEKLTSAPAADLSLLPGNADRSTLRGVFGADFKSAGTGIPADLRLGFRKEFAGQFANIYKLVDNKFVFKCCSEVGADGSAIITGAETAGEYIVMVCKYSDLPGDADNNGTLNAMDAAALLKEIIGISESTNPLMCDFNGDGTVNALDAAAILRAVVSA